jgi:hypothetical protein
LMASIAPSGGYDIGTVNERMSQFIKNLNVGSPLGGFDDVWFIQARDNGLRD